jgi:hypothetical protein
MLICTSTSQYVCLAQCIVKHRANFPVAFLRRLSCFLTSQRVAFDDLSACSSSILLGLAKVNFPESYRVSVIVNRHRTEWSA